MGGKLCPLSPPRSQGRDAVTSPSHAVPPAAAPRARSEKPGARPGLCCNPRASAGAQGQGCKTFTHPAPHLCRLPVGSQGCPPPGTLQRPSAQASESLESREYGEKPELKITAGRDDLPSPVLPSDRRPVERGCGSRQREELSLSGSRLATAVPPAVKPLGQPCREGRRERGSAARAHRHPPARAAKLPVPPPASQDRDGKFRWAAMSTSRKHLTLETYSPPPPP